MAETAQLRIYRVQEGRLEEFVRAWRDGVVPLRRKAGFRIRGAWTLVGEDRFVWIISCEGGTEDFEERDAAYYASPGRADLTPDPAAMLEEAEHHLMTPVDVPDA